MNADCVDTDINGTARDDPQWARYSRKYSTLQGRCPRVGTTTADLLFPPLSDGRVDVGRDATVRERGDTSSGEHGSARAFAARLLGVRRFMGQAVPRRRRRSFTQGIVPRVRVALGQMRVLRESTKQRGGNLGGETRRADELRDIGRLRRATACRALLRRGDHVAT